MPKTVITVKVSIREPMPTSLASNRDFQMRVKKLPVEARIIDEAGKRVVEIMGIRSDVSNPQDIATDVSNVLLLDAQTGSLSAHDASPFEITVLNQRTDEV